MEGLRLPEIDKNRIIEQQMTLALDADSNYDAILGMDFLSKVSIVLNYVTGKLQWFGNSISLRETPSPEQYEDDFQATLDNR